MLFRRRSPTEDQWAAGIPGPPRFEVIPLAGIFDDVVAHTPPGATVTVTASPRRGMGPTVELATDLAPHGWHAVPHLAARLISDEKQLGRIIQTLEAAGVSEVFVIGGDPDQPAGDFDSALSLLQAMAGFGHNFRVGIAGYPEPHPKISDDLTIQAMWDKQPYASYVVSQMCFTAAPVMSWVRRLRQRGITLPILAGVAGPASTSHLLRISNRLGVGQSVRVLSSHRSGIWRLARPGTWRPDRLLNDLSPAFADPATGIAGVHMYTFNAVSATTQWWRETVGTVGPHAGWIPATTTDHTLRENPHDTDHQYTGQPGDRTHSDPQTH